MARAKRGVPARHRSLGQMALAGLVLLVAVWLLLHFVLAVVAFVASIIVVVVAVAAVVWALRVLL